MTEVIAFIPARGGSKGIPHKNMYPLNGKPLLSYTIESARESGVFNRIVVSSDNDEILTFARQQQVEADKRDSDLARDDTPMDPVIADFVDKRQLAADTTLILLQPTSPLRTAKHIVEAWNRFNGNTGAALISVYPLERKILKAYLLEDKFLCPIHSRETAYTRRQDLPAVFMPNGAIYIFSVASFRRENGIPRSEILSYVMSEQDSLDVDTDQDLRLCSRLLAEREENVRG